MFPKANYLTDFHVRQGEIHPQLVSTHLQNSIKVIGTPVKCRGK